SFLLIFVTSGTVFAEGIESTENAGESRSVITGKVTDKLSGEELVCANIFIDGLDMKVCTDVEGKFSISNLEPGNYTIKVSYISYKETVVENVRIKKNKSNELEILLEPISFQ
ncbi:MAG: carboxypeptidase-like regulatory domain-containing protein, partial [Bacteroidetes bacterium]|nr:carboxypeptidase-like regulatory domain-containing protein [Bacteroidota bacterium]